MLLLVAAVVGSGCLAQPGADRVEQVSISPYEGPSEGLTTVTVEDRHFAGLPEKWHQGFQSAAATGHGKVVLERADELNDFRAHMFEQTAADGPPSTGRIFWRYQGQVFMMGMLG